MVASIAFFSVHGEIYHITVYENTILSLKSIIALRTATKNGCRDLWDIRRHSFSHGKVSSEILLHAESLERYFLS